MAFVANVLFLLDILTPGGLDRGQMWGAKLCGSQKVCCHQYLFRITAFLLT